jgi:hypothetical protein
MQYKNGLIRGVHSLEGDNSEILDHLSASGGRGLTREVAFGGRGLTREGTTVHVLYRNLFYTDVSDRPFNLKGGVWFFVSFRIFFFGQHKSLNSAIFFLSKF